MKRPMQHQKKEKNNYHGVAAVIRNQRVIIAVILVIASLGAIFIPFSSNYNGTNLQFGLDLDGGSWIQLEFQSDVVTVENTDDIFTIANTMGKALDCNVNVISKNQVEVDKKFTESQLWEAVTAAGGVFKNTQPGLGKDTADTIKRTLESKINSLGTSDVKVNILTGFDGIAQYVRIEMAGVDMQEAQNIVGNQGLFEIRIQITDNETTHVLYGQNVQSVQNPTKTTTGVWGVGFTLDTEGADAFRQACIGTGATCYPDQHYINMYLDGEEVYSAPLSTSLAASFAKTTVSSLSASTGTGDKGYEKAKELEVHLRAGALPVEVKIAGSGSTSAALGDYFKVICIIAALAALAAVALMVYLRYRIISIVVPMILTNIAEFVILLGIAVFLQQLDLAAIAALIAVLGTGIDQLVIITDEVVHGGVVPGRNLYLKRLKRALIIIMTSAATVIIAMFPLIIMDLSTLKGFAIINILGILIGVIITRPAYGKIIMEIMANRKLKE